MEKKMSENNQLLQNLLIDAIEGGSNYWYMIEDKSSNAPYYEAPFNKGESITISNRVISENEGIDLISKVIDVKVMRNALDALKASYPDRYKSIIKGNYDAVDADIFLQIAVIGKVMYG